MCNLTFKFSVCIDMTVHNHLYKKVNVAICLNGTILVMLLEFPMPTFLCWFVWRHSCLTNWTHSNPIDNENNSLC